MDYNKRVNDAMLKSMKDSLDSLKLLVREISQRQSEFTIPKLENLEKCMFGNGQPGIIAEHIACQQKLININNDLEGIQAIKRTMHKTLVTVILAILTFAVGYGILLGKVEMLVKDIKIIPFTGMSVGK